MTKKPWNPINTKSNIFINVYIYYDLINVYINISSDYILYISYLKMAFVPVTNI